MDATGESNLESKAFSSALWKFAERLPEHLISFIISTTQHICRVHLAVQLQNISFLVILLKSQSEMRAIFKEKFGRCIQSNESKTPRLNKF